MIAGEQKRGGSPGSLDPEHDRVVFAQQSFPNHDPITTARLQGKPDGRQGSGGELAEMEGGIGSPWAVGQLGFARADDVPADCLTNDGNQVRKRSTGSHFPIDGAVSPPAGL